MHETSAIQKRIDENTIIKRRNEKKNQKKIIIDLKYSLSIQFLADFSRFFFLKTFSDFAESKNKLFT